jgi:excisionase family DNA binding protein
MLKADPNSLVVGTQEAMVLLNISHQRIYEFLESGEIPAVRIGSKWLISRKTIDQLIAGEIRPDTKKSADDSGPALLEVSPGGLAGT